MNDEDLSQVSYNVRYVKTEPGQLIFPQGDIAD